MKVNLPKKFRLNTDNIIILKPQDIERFSTLFYLHIPNIEEVYNAFVIKGFNTISKNGYYHLTKSVNSFIMDVKIYDDGFIEGSIGLKNQMVNVIYEVYDQFKDVYKDLHIFYKSDWDDRKGWIIDIMQYFRIEFPPASEIPWKPRIIEIPSLGGFLKRFKMM